MGSSILDAQALKETSPTLQKNRKVTIFSLTEKKMCTYFEISYKFPIKNKDTFFLISNFK